MRALLTLLALSLPAFGQLGLPNLVTVEVKEVASSMRVTNGLVDKDYSRRRSLEASIRNVGRAATSYRLEVFWLIKPIKAGNWLPEIGFRESAEMPVANSGFKEKFLTFNSPEIVGNVTNADLVALGSDYSSGAKLYGWIVMASKDGKVVGIKAGSEDMLRLVTDSKGWAKMLATYKEIDKDAPDAPRLP